MVLLEKVLTHETRIDWIVAGKGLNSTFSPALSGFGLGNRYQTRTMQHRQFGWMPLAATDGKSLQRRGLGIVGEYSTTVLVSTPLPFMPLP